MGSEGTSGAPKHVIDFSVHFAKIYDVVAANDADFIDSFIEHAEEHGLVGLPGRLKCSWDIPPDDPQFASKTQYAKKWNLWHYHVGMPHYDMTNGHGDFTSQWVLHLRRHPCGLYTTIVDWDPHPPFVLPKENTLWRPGESPQS
jgi:hypothetical protein